MADPASLAHVSGVSELHEAVQQLSSQLNQHLPAMVQQAAQLIEADIQMRMPQDSGALKRAVQHTVTRQSLQATAEVFIADSAPGGAHHYAVFQEYGTQHLPAQPFMRPAVLAARQPVQRLLQTQLLQVIA
jgi:HK97 gp10 family phage protein